MQRMHATQSSKAAGMSVDAEPIWTLYTRRLKGIAAVLTRLVKEMDPVITSRTPPKKNPSTRRKSAPLTTCKVGMPRKEKPNRADSGYHIEFQAYLASRLPNPGTT